VSAASKKTPAPARGRASSDALAEIRDGLLETYAINDAMNQLLLSHLDA
jgi:hypothetical protein